MPVDVGEVLPHWVLRAWKATPPDPGPALPYACVEWYLERIGEDNHKEAVGTNVSMAK